MRCCEFYTPSQSDDENHDGLGESEHYLFDRKVHRPACSNDEIRGNSPFGACGVARSMDMCSVYSPEAATIIKHVKSGDTELRLEKIRVTYGVIHFQILQKTAEEESVVQTFDAHALGKREAFSQAVASMKETIDEFPEGSVENIAVDVNTPEEFSYIIEAANAL